MSFASHRARLATLVGLAALSGALLAPSAQADNDRQQASSPRAAKALAAVQDSFAGAGGADRTIALRDLAATRSELAPAQRAKADAYLARPTAERRANVRGDVTYAVEEATPACDESICVHYVTSTDAAPDPTDLQDASGEPGENGIPDYVDTVLREMGLIHEQYLAAGYRAPKSDGTAGGDSRIDVYIANIGADGTYGYCTSDDPRTNVEGAYDVWAYCVLDDDYSEFTAQNTPIDSLRVTAAHEYFHAVQFGYDYLEDAWLLEATAAWIEDEVYPSVNDNRQYLANSPLTRPGLSMDQFIGEGSLSGWHYGVWIFFRNLSERFPTAEGGLPTIVRDIWDRVDAAGEAPDQYSWQAVDGALRARGITAAAAFADFAVGNRLPGRTYAEGAALRYPTAAPVGSVVLRDLKTRVVTRKINHLASATYRFTPKVPAARRLTVTIDAPATVRGSRAIVTSFAKSGAISRKVVPLNSSTGNGALTVPFGSVKFVEVTLVNASGRFACFRNTAFSCQGVPVDDAQPFKLTYRVR
ncbi:MXAN_6640 family putative metalloprotease [Nocardioides sp.]|uniref:MXAN_6640 family putative metalloprotease n=1 Tax=Nocardioides sp. TaxID=35761 RepID=UPI0035199C06